jgi:type I restriction enzyme R subunit
MLVQQYRDAKGDGDDTETRDTISRAVNSSPSLRNNKDLIESFVDSLTVDSDVGKDWQAFIAVKRAQELGRIVEEVNLNPEAARDFIETAFRDSAIQAGGTAITRILPPVSRFTAGSNHAIKKQTVLDKLGVFFDRFFRLG